MTFFASAGSSSLSLLDAGLRMIIFALVASSVAYAAERPNILLVLTDDQGWGTLGCYGGKVVQTPNLDRLASEGARFTSAYVTSQCTPTRATLLSGQYTARNRMWHVIRWYGCPWAPVEEQPFAEQFPRGKATIASELKLAGYVTGIMGKWHLTSNSDGDYQGLRPQHSHHYGFDYAAPILSKDEFREGADRGVQTLTRQALEFISENRERPWFCYLSHHMIHGNVVAPKDIEDVYRARGYGNDGPNRAVYLAGLDVIDQSIGTLMQRLDELGEADETVVIFLSDNGGIHERLDHRSRPLPEPLRFKPNLIEYDNAPLRNGKGSIYEGGVRVPLVIRWPGEIAPETVIDTPVHAIDLAPTLFSIAGHSPTADLILDGVDLTHIMKRGSNDRLHQRPLFQYCPFYDLNWGLTPCASVRQGRYKLIDFFGDRFDRRHQYVPGHRLELYDLEADLGETKNLAEEMPEVTTALSKLLHDWMQELEVKRSARNPHFDPSRAFDTTNRKPESLLRQEP